MSQEVKFKQISTATIQEGHSHNLYIFALDEDGQLWQWMRGTWGKMKHPHKEVPEPNVR